MARWNLDKWCPCRSTRMTSVACRNKGSAAFLDKIKEHYALGNMIRENGLPLRKFDGRDGPLAIMAPDRNSQTVHLVEPNVLYRPGLPIRKDYGLADKLRLSLIECTDDR
jgi:hypothetical protein